MSALIQDQEHSYEAAPANRMMIDKVFVAYTFCIPLMPRATASGVERFVVPVMLAGLLCVWFFSMSKCRRVSANFQLLGLVIGFPTIVFLTRIVLLGVMADEGMHLVSRILFGIGLFAFAHWCTVTTVSKETIFRAFTFGFMATAVVTVFSGVTGVQILEEDSIKPSRFFGLSKSTGIFRSFGEFGIMGCIAWSYLLVYGRQMRSHVWVVGMLLVSLAMLISQSRNVYLAWTIVTAFVLLSRAVRLPKIVGGAVACLIILMPVAVELSVPILQETEIGNKLVGTGTILERNVDVRFDQFRDAYTLTTRDPSRALLGFSRQDWRDLMLETHINVVAPHNYFLSTLVFLGFVGGGVWIVGLYIMPAILVSRLLHLNDPVVVVCFVSLLGVILGLSFYEGFFSVVVMFVLAMAWSVAFSEETIASNG